MRAEYKGTMTAMFGRRRNRSAPQALDVAERVRRRVASGQAFDDILGEAQDGRPAQSGSNSRSEGAAKPRPSAQVLSFDETPVYQVESRSGLARRVQQQVLKRALAQLAPERKLAESRRARQARMQRVLDAVLAELRLHPDTAQRATLLERLGDEMADLGPLAALLRDPSVGDIMINGPDQIYVQRRDRLQPTDLAFLDQAHLLSIARRLLGRAAVALDQGELSVAAWRPDGSRVQVLLPPLSPQGPAITLRRFRHEPLTLARLVRRDSLSATMARFLELAVRCRLNLLICGPRGAGKTTLLNALAQLIVPDERIVTVEEARELRLDQPHVLQLDTAPLTLSASGRSAISLDSLLSSALRMRPGRLLVGELHHGEVARLLTALDAGQNGTLATIAAEDAEAALGRLESLAGFELRARQWSATVTRAIDLLVQVEQTGDGQRRVARIAELSAAQDGQLSLRDLFVYDGKKGEGQVRSRVRAKDATPRCLARAARFGCTEEMTNLIGWGD